MDLTTLTIEQLKAMAFDAVVAKENAQATLNAVLPEINKRNTPAPFAPAQEPAVTDVIEGNNAE